MEAGQKLMEVFSTEHLHADLKGRSVRGGVMTITSQGVQFVMQSISTVVLAHLLTPVDFGLVAMVTAITNLAQAFADLGLSEATIQQQNINHQQVSTLFWINTAIGALLMGLTAALAPVLVWFYHEPRLRNIAFLASLTFLFGGLRVQHNALLMRQMRYAAMALRDIIAIAVAVPFAIFVAMRGGGYWAILTFPLTFNFLQMSLSWVMIRWIPGLPRRGAQVRSMLAFGGKVAASYLVTNINRSADSVLIGWHWGASPLGLYSRAYNLLMLPIRQLSGPATRVAVPTFSRLQNDPEVFARFYLRAANLMTWITTPIFGYLFVAAEPVIVLVLGRQWRDAAPVFQILAIAALGQLFFDSTLWLFVSRGQSGRMLKLLLFISPVIIGSFAVGLPFGIKGVAFSGSLVLVGIFPWVLKYTFRGTQLTLMDFGRAITPPIAVCGMGILLAELALRLILPQQLIAKLAVSALGFAVAYLLSALLPSIRGEVLALRRLFDELRFSRQTA